MKAISFQKGIPLTPFLTAAGFLAAILLVWAQSWINAYEPPWPETVYLGLMWTYSAVIVAVLASALAILSWFRERTSINFKYFTVQGCPIALLVAAFIMTVMDVGQSLVSVIMKPIKNIPSNAPLVDLSPLRITVCGYALTLPLSIVFAITLALAVMIVVMSYLALRKSRWLLVELVFIAAIAGIFYYSVWAAPIIDC